MKWIFGLNQITIQGTATYRMSSQKEVYSMIEVHIQTLLNDYDQMTDAKKSDRQILFSNTMIDFYTGTTHLSCGNKSLNEKEIENFLNLLSSTVYNTQKNQGWESIITCIVIKTSQNFREITGQSHEILNKYTQESGDDWHKLLSSITPDRYKTYFSGQKAGLFGFYLAIHCQHAELAFLWASLGDDFNDLSKAQQAALFKLAYERNIDYLKRRLENLSLPENVFLVQEKVNLYLEPAAKLIGSTMSTFRPYLSFTPYRPITTEDSERYPRSTKHPLLHGNTKEKHRRYSKNLDQGDRSHLGDFVNPIQLVGDEAQFTLNAHLITRSDGVLYNLMLAHQEKLSALVVAQTNGQTQYLKIGVYNHYPCVMVFMPEDKVRPFFGFGRQKKTFNTVFESWIAICISLFTGLMNHLAYQNHIPLEMLRRSSFGFLTSTVSPTARSFRINMGLVPDAYAQLVAQALILYDGALRLLFEDPGEIPHDTFVTQNNYKVYLDNQKDHEREIFRITNLMHFLFAKAEKSAPGKTTIQSIERTAYARQKISWGVFSQLEALRQTVNQHHLYEIFKSTLCWSISQLYLDKTLSFNQSIDIIYPVNFNCLEQVSIEDNDFWSMVQTILSRFKSIQTNSPNLSTVINAFEQYCQYKKIDKLHYYLNMITELLFAQSIREKQVHLYGDGYGSDSDTEAEVCNHKIYSKKLIVHNGMRATLATLLGIVNYHITKKPTYSARVYCEHAYYEIIKGIELAKTQHNGSDYIHVTKNKVEANIIIFDLSSCVVNGESTPELIAILAMSKGKTIIFDSTSTTTQQCHDYLKQIIEHYDNQNAVFFVSSGLKNEQLGSDKNHYGTIRIFSKDKAMRDFIWSDIKRFEPPVNSPVAHSYRRKMKGLGAVPTNALILNPASSTGIKTLTS